MEGFLKKLTQTFAQFVPVVRADDSEEEVTDPQEILRYQCQKKECANFFEKLEICNERVRSKKKTAETCDEEMIDFIECIDHCAAKTLFSKLKHQLESTKLQWSNFIGIKQ